MQLSAIFEKLINSQDLTQSEMQGIIHRCMQGQLTDAQLAAFLALMRMKGETVDELTVAAQTMHAFGLPLNLGDQLLDIVGTGGDGKQTFNISTACCFVVAAAGIKIAKHGNRSVSSRSGSADLLEQAGFKLDLPTEALQSCFQASGIAFLFAPHYHPALQQARTARQQLGIRTLFNLLGPLLNPAQAKRQVIGVFSKQWMKPMAQVLANLGSQRTLVMHSRDGLDEISIAAPTELIEYHQNKFHAWTINPADFGLAHSDLESILVSSAAESLEQVLSVLAAEKGPARDIVLLNAAAAIYCATSNLSFATALEQAKEAIDSGRAAARFAQLQQLHRDHL